MQAGGLRGVTSGEWHWWEGGGSLLKKSKLLNFHSYVCTYFEKERRPLARVAQWIERRTSKQEVMGSIPSQGTWLGCGPGSPVGGMQEATTH